MPHIEFRASASELDKLPHPYPASRHVPEWFKNMPVDFGGDGPSGGTLKRCPPFLAAMTAGYIIPAPADVRLVMSDAGELEAYGQQLFLSTHFPQQYASSPFTKNRVVKFHNPWVIVTPPEYVCMVMAPVNRFEIPFLPLAGIIETGSYYKEVQLPMACLMKPGETFTLRCGAPMIQVIPMLREAWEQLSGPLDLARRTELQEKFDRNRHTYKEEIWKKLEFS